MGGYACFWPARDTRLKDDGEGRSTEIDVGRSEEIVQITDDGGRSKETDVGHSEEIVQITDEGGRSKETVQIIDEGGRSKETIEIVDDDVATVGEESSNEIGVN